METTDYPKIHVVDEWFADGDILCVQLVEVAFSRRDQLAGGRFAVRIRITDADAEATVGMVIPPNTAMELCDALGQSLKRHERLTEVKR